MKVFTRSLIFGHRIGLIGGGDADAFGLVLGQIYDVRRIRGKVRAGRRSLLVALLIHVREQEPEVGRGGIGQFEPGGR